VQENADSRAIQETLKGYYRLQSKIYDATRWSFLFGRRSLIEEVTSQASPGRVLEVGCGTGGNLVQLARALPRAELFGLDLSEHMLVRALSKAQSSGNVFHALHRAYDAPVYTDGGFDLVLFSYSLSMFNPGWEKALDNTLEDLAPDGLVAVVDFHKTPFRPFSSWMRANHVRMGGHLFDALRARFSPLLASIRPAFGGVWTYFQFIGRTKES
jgi:S-adenosylmethionine-diacylgycerolhomoserine-N-methlytransferase